MVIKSIHIKNFRSIVDEVIQFSELTCFVGRNDSGKSNVLKALNLFFNDETEHGKPIDFENDYSKCAKKGSKQAKEITIEVEIIVPESFKDHGIKVWKKIWRKEGLRSDNMFEIFATGSRGATFLSRIKYFYIPAVKSDDFFKSLLSKIYDSMTQEANGALRELNSQYSIQLHNLTSALSTEIEKLLGLESHLMMPSNLSALFRDLSFNTSDNAISGIDLSHRGDGIKARHIPPILRFIQNSVERSRPSRSVYGTYIWGYEEPENGVEYLSCFEMAKEFISYLADCQILLTTHSPAFYSQCNNSERICYFAQKQNGQSKYEGTDVSVLNETMGLMQIVAPIIELARQSMLTNSGEATTNLIKNIRDAIEILRRGETRLDGAQVLSFIDEYSAALEMLDAYDHGRIAKPEGHTSAYVLTYEECRDVIDSMKYNAESDLFGNEKDSSFKGSIGNIYQTFGGVDVYPTTEEKAANLLYFITKNHSFSDGNKRIAAAIFLYFLEKNSLLYVNGEKVLSDDTLVSITVMIAESKPSEKEMIIHLVMNILNHTSSSAG